MPAIFLLPGNNQLKVAWRRHEYIHAFQLFIKRSSCCHRKTQRATT